MASTPLLPPNQSSSRTPSLPQSSFLWRSGALLAATGMLSGAFGSHALRGRVTPEQQATFITSAHYAIFNGLGLLAVSLHPRFSTHRYAGMAILVGALLFSGSIAAIVLNRERFRFLHPVTPIGGLLSVSGYITLAL